MNVVLQLQKSRKFKNILDRNTSVNVAAYLGVATLGLLPLNAMGSGFDKLLNLPLKELMNIRVDVASKRPESILWTPASISSYTKNDIRSLGYYNLAELANITPGYSVYTDIGENTLETRGQRATGFDNNRHLLLIDGIPMNHLRSSALQADENLPLYFADQVDFLRGPASALYGVSAFYGVVNIRPSEIETLDGQVEVRVSQGNNDNDKRLLVNYLDATSTGKGGLRLGYFDKGSSQDIVKGDPEHLNFDDQQSLFAYGSWEWSQGWLEGFKSGLVLMKKQGGLGNFWADYSSEGNEITWENFVWYSKYRDEIAPSLRLNSFVKYAQSGEAAIFYDASETLMSSYDYLFHSYEGQVELDWSISDKGSLLGGINYDTRYGEQSAVIIQNVSAITERTPDLITRSFYLQYKQRLEKINNAEITLGMREDQGDAGADRYSKLSPRIAYVQGLSEHSTVKLLYGEALRGPSVKEIGVNAEVTRDNPAAVLKALAPEEIATIEIVQMYQADNWLGLITLFRNETENFIGRDWDNLGEYINTLGVTRSKGAELEIKYFLPQGDQVFANYSLAKTKDPRGTELNDIPTQKLNIGWLWKNLAEIPVSGAIVGRWIRGYSVAESGKENNSGSFVLDINGKYQVSKHLTLELVIRNLFDKQYYLPRQGEDNLIMPQQSAMLALELSY